MIGSSLHRATGLHDHRDARGRGRLDAVGERVERVATRTRRRRARPAAFFAAISPDSTRFCCPAPMPTAWPSFTSTIAFDFTCPQMRHASSASRHSASVGATLGDDAPVVARRRRSGAASCTRNPPRDLAEVEGLRLRRGRLEQARVLALRDQRLDRARLVARARSPRRPAGPRPCARRWRRRSGGSARRCRRTRSARRTRARAGTRSARSSATATPHGLACLMMAHASGPVAEVVHEAPRGVGVVEVEVREREAAVLLDAVPPARGARDAVARRRAGAGSRRSAAPRRCARARGRCAAGSSSSRCEPRDDRGVVRGGAARTRRRASARRVSSPTVSSLASQLLEHGAYCDGSVTIADARVVLRRRPHHRRAADVDGLDAGVLARTGRGSRPPGRTAGCRRSPCRRRATPSTGRRGSRRGSSGAA